MYRFFFCLSLSLSLSLAAPAALAQRTLSDREARALNCAAMFNVGSAELRRAGRIDMGTESVIQTFALDMLGELSVNRRTRTELLNRQMAAMIAGKSSEQLLLDYGLMEGRCRQEFLR